MNFNQLLEKKKVKYKNELENLLGDVLTFGREKVIEYENEDDEKEKKNLGYVIDSLRRDACNISQELNGSITYGGRKFDDMVDETTKDYNSTVKKDRFVMYIDGIQSVVETKIPMTKNEVELELELELVDDNISDVYPLESGLDE